MPTPKWKLVVDVGSTPPSKADEAKPVDKRSSEVLKLLADHTPTHRNSPYSPYLPGFTSLRLLLLKRAKTKEDEDTISTMLESYSSYLSSGKSNSETAWMIARDYMLLTQPASQQGNVVMPQTQASIQQQQQHQHQQALQQSVQQQQQQLQAALQAHAAQGNMLQQNSTAGLQIQQAVALQNQLLHQQQQALQLQQMQNAQLQMMKDPLGQLPMAQAMASGVAGANVMHLRTLGASPLSLGQFPSQQTGDGKDEMSALGQVAQRQVTQNGINLAQNGMQTGASNNPQQQQNGNS
jgi:hypothetical protein